jgi:putative CocE/NonD family hydrolase
MMDSIFRRGPVWAILALSLFLAACGSSDDATGDRVDARWTPYDRAAEYPSSVSLPQQVITLRDGVRLVAAVRLPADANGNPVSQPLPVILTQTGYNKGLPVIPAFNEYLVQRGYVHVSVDVRGTGGSEGAWEAFGETEQADYAEVMDWVATQPWSNGEIGTWGASFMGITQLLTAAQQHPAHRAAFAIVPMGDAYRDIVFSGGQTNIGFIPLWMGLVTALSIIPTPDLVQDPALYVGSAVQNIIAAITSFQVPILAQAVLGGEIAYDGPFWRTRSPIEVADRIRVPTFIVGGLKDIFQRGEPMLYEAIARNTDAKLLIGPWEHLGGSSGAGLDGTGIPNLNQIALQWFDHYLRGMDSGAPAQPTVTQYYWGAERYALANDWPHPAARAERWYLQAGGDLAAAPPAQAGIDRTLLLPVNGLCSSSASQWTAGILGLVLGPCTQDNRINELVEITYTTPVMDEDYAVNGPIQADLWVSSTTADTGVNVRITLVDPQGRSFELTHGLLNASARAVDPARSRYLDGQMIQPWHIFTREARDVPGRGNIVPVNVEVFPSSFVIPAGHRLRVTVGPSDFPHGLPPVPDLLNQLLGIIRVHTGPQTPSSIVLPVVPVSSLVPVS